MLSRDRAQQFAGKEHSVVAQGVSPPLAVNVGESLVRSEGWEDALEVTCHPSCEHYRLTIATNCVFIILEFSISGVNVGKR